MPHREEHPLTTTRARDLKPGDVLTLGGKTGYVVQHVEPADHCWLRVDVKTPTGGAHRFQAAPNSPFEVAATDARALCAAPCPRGHGHTCARSPKHTGFHRDVKQKGDESCSWTGEETSAAQPLTPAEISMIDTAVDRTRSELAALLCRTPAEIAQASLGVLDAERDALRAELDEAKTYIRILEQQRADLRRGRSAAEEAAAESMRERAAEIAKSDPTCDYEIMRYIRDLPLMADEETD